MEVWLLDTNFQQVAVVDEFDSLLWTDRYREYGDFEIYCFPNDTVLTNSKINYYVRNLESEHMMIVEKREITTSVEDGDRLILSGRSLESILMRRVVWTQTTINGNFQNGIKQLLIDAFISPADAQRKVDNFVFEENDDPEITKLTLDAQYTGDNLYDVIKSACESNDIGFKVVLNDSNQFVFSLYKGKNRSYKQTANAYVVFSPAFENIIDSSFSEDITDYKNVGLIGGDGEGPERKFASTGSGIGIERRELFVDARDISSKNENNEAIAENEYKQLLIQRGEENLAEATSNREFDSEVDTTQMFMYGKDFWIGDRVQVSNQYGLSGTSLITEIIWSQDTSGISCYPTFVSDALDDEIEDTPVIDPDESSDRGTWTIACETGYGSFQGTAVFELVITYARVNTDGGSSMTVNARLICTTCPASGMNAAWFLNGTGEKVIAADGYTIGSWSGGMRITNKAVMQSGTEMWAGSQTFSVMGSAFKISVDEMLWYHTGSPGCSFKIPASSKSIEIK